MIDGKSFHSFAATARAIGQTFMDGIRWVKVGVVSLFAHAVKTRAQPAGEGSAGRALSTARNIEVFRPEDAAVPALEGSSQRPPGEVTIHSAGAQPPTEPDPAHVFEGVRAFIQAGARKGMSSDCLQEKNFLRDNSPALTQLQRILVAKLDASAKQVTADLRARLPADTPAAGDDAVFEAIQDTFRGAAPGQFDSGAIRLLKDLAVVVQSEQRERHLPVMPDAARRVVSDRIGLRMMSNGLLLGGNKELGRLLQQAIANPGSLGADSPRARAHGAINAFWDALLGPDGGAPIAASH